MGLLGFRLPAGLNEAEYALVERHPVALEMHHVRSIVDAQLPPERAGGESREESRRLFLVHLCVIAAKYDEEWRCHAARLVGIDAGVRRLDVSYRAIRNANLTRPVAGSVGSGCLELLSPSLPESRLQQNEARRQDVLEIKLLQARFGSHAPPGHVLALGLRAGLRDNGTEQRERGQRAGMMRGKIGGRNRPP